MVVVVLAIAGVCLKRKMSTTTNSDDVDADGESAYGASPLARQAAVAAVSSIERYLEFADRHLAPPIAAHHGLEPDRVTVGQGSDDLLARLARAYLAPGDRPARTPGQGSRILELGPVARRGGVPALCRPFRRSQEGKGRLSPVQLARMARLRRRRPGRHGLSHH